MKPLELVKRTARAVVDQVAEAEAGLRATRAEIAAARAQAHELDQAWLTASTQEAAEELARRSLELRRVAERGEKQIPQLEAQLVAAKAEQQRQGLARHRAAIAAFVPELVAAVERVAAVQVEAIKLREAANAELGEGVVAANIPHLAYAGILLPDLCAMWRQDLERMFAPPAAAPPRPVPAPVKAAPNPPIAAPPRPRPARPPRRDPPPQDPNQVAVTMLRGGVELGDGTQSVVGDHCTMMVDQARLLVLRGAADYAQKDRANA